MKKLVTEVNLARCDALQTVLEVRGIRCTIKNEYSSIESGGTFARPELWVIDDAQFEEARAILREEETEHVRSGDATERALASDENSHSTQEARRAKHKRNILISLALTVVVAGLVYAVVQGIRQSAAAYYFDRGYTYDSNADYDSAIAAYSEAIQSKPNYWEAYYNRAIAKENKGDLDGATEDYTRVVEINPNDLQVRSFRAYAKVRKGDFDGAIADYNYVIRWDPTRADAYYYRADVKNRKGDLDGAIADCDRAIEINAKDPYAYIIRSFAKSEKGNLDEAIADCNQAINLKAHDTQAHYARGWAKFASNDLDGAIADHTRAIEIDSKNVDAYGSRGDAYVLKRNWNLALADYRRCCELGSQGEDGSHPMIWIVRMQLGEKEVADKELAAYLQKRKNTPASNWSIKVAGFLLNKISESDLITASASSDFKKERGQRCSAWFVVGMKRLLAGEKTAAASCFQKSLATKAKDWTEYYLAQAELKALGQ
ncbi:MAG: tetratricopeptide repeat protein [Verrucomicrobiia bacterium]